MSLRQQNKARARANILDAAAQLIAQRGVTQTTTRDIAKLAGVSYQTLYNYYPSKAQLVHDLLASDMSQWSTRVDLLIKQYDGQLLDTLSQLHRVALEQIAGEKRDLWREIGTIMFSQEMGEEMIAINNMAHERYYALLAMAQGMGHLQANLDLHLMAHTLYSLGDYALLKVFVTPQIDTMLQLQTLDEQVALVLTPHLIGG